MYPVDDEREIIDSFTGTKLAEIILNGKVLCSSLEFNNVLIKCEILGSVLQNAERSKVKSPEDFPGSRLNIF